MPVDPAVRLRLAHELLHDLADMLDVETRAVKCAVRGNRAQDLANRLQAAVARPNVMVKVPTRSSLTVVTRSTHARSDRRLPA